MVIHNTPLHYAIINSFDINLLNFNELITNQDGIRYSLDNTKGIVKWKGNTIPQSIQKLSIFEGPYTMEEIQNILKSNEWECLE